LSPSSNVGENLSHDVAEIMPAWKNELSERLAATRTRRLRNQVNQIALPGLEGVRRKTESRAAVLAAKVAQRYANAPSYSEVLAAEARARAEAAAAAAAAARTAVEEIPIIAPPAPDEWDEMPCAEEEQVAEPVLLDEEPALAVVEPLAVNVIDFPRELVAARKLRPRLAEGPLREEKDQLKIFEVTPESISQSVSIGKAPANWAPIRLDNDSVDSTAGGEPLTSQIPLKTASLEDRIMAGIFDLALVVAAFSVFIMVFVACTAHPPTGKPALLAAGGVLTAFFLLYQYLFFKYADGTPGMRYAKIALCTFEDENPTRKAMCRRVWFFLLSAAPLGLGFAWAMFDPDRLSWHDRLSRIYQRSYS
jgi:uncharacterized RDD family membrane protein YckC